MSYSAAMTVSDRVRQRLKDAMADLDMSQRELSEVLSSQTQETWSQSRVLKVLNGHVELRVEDVNAIAGVVGISLCEAVRDPGMEFYAEMTPTELRLFQVLRRKPSQLDAMMTLLGVPRPASERPPDVLTMPPKPKRGRPLNSTGPRYDPDLTRPTDENSSNVPKITHKPKHPK